MIRILGYGASLLSLIALCVFIAHEGRGRFFRAESLEYAFDPEGKATPEAMSTVEFTPLKVGTVPPKARVVWLKIKLPREALGPQKEGLVLYTGSNETAWSMHPFVRSPDGHVKDLGLCDATISVETCRDPGLEYVFPLYDVTFTSGDELLLRVESNAMGVFNEFYFMRSGYYRRVAIFLPLLVGSMEGFCIFVILTFLVLAASLRDKGFLFYSIYHLSLLTNLNVNRGVWDMFIASAFVPNAATVSVFALGLTFALEFVFFIVFFDFRNTQPRLFRFFFAAIAILAAIMCGSFFPPTRVFAWKCFLPFGAVSMVMITATIIYLLLKKRRWAEGVALTWMVGGGATLVWIGYRELLFNGHWILGFAGAIGKLVASLLLMVVTFQKLQALMSARAQANTTEQENRVIRVLFRTLSHDLSNFTQSLSGTCHAFQSAEGEPVGKETVSKLTEMVHSQAAVLQHAKQNFVSRGDGVIALNSVRLCDCYRQLENLFSATCRFKGVSLRMEPVAETVQVLAEPVTLTHQVLSNLISNAIKFSSMGDEVTVRTWISDEEVRISVEDKGIGMPPEILQNLFNESVEVSRPGTAGEKGTGLGMLVVRDFVALYGGRLTVASKAGTSITVTLRRAGTMVRPIAAKLLRSADT